MPSKDAHGTGGHTWQYAPESGNGQAHEGPTVDSAATGRGDAWDDAANSMPTVDEPTAFANYRVEEYVEGGRTNRIKAGLPLPVIRDDLLGRTGGWPRRVGELLFAEGAELLPQWLESTDSLFAWAGTRLEHIGANPVQWSRGQGMATKGELFACLQQTAQGYDGIEGFPHEPLMPRTYYMHRATEGGDGRALGQLLARFCPATPADGDLLRAFFLSLCWGGLPGQRPAWLFTSEDDDAQGGRGVGKSKVVQLGARLVGGHLDAAAGESLDKLITRLLSADGRARRVVLFDNVKTLRFSCAELEGLITSDTISGHQMYTGEGRRPNTLTYCMTLNGASLSRDMAQRCVIVKVARPPHDPAWESDVVGFIEEQRWAILGDILAALRAPAPPLKCRSRWGAWESAILSRVADPTVCQLVMEERQGDVDDDSAEADMIRDAFAEELRRRGHNPNDEVVWIPTKDAAAIVFAATGTHRAANKASSYLRTLNIQEIRDKRDGLKGRAWVWHGKNAALDERAVCINPDDGIPP